MQRLFMATFLRIGALADRLNIAVRTIHDRVRRDPHFPKPVKLGSAPQSPLGFEVSEVETYEMRLMAARAGVRSAGEPSDRSKAETRP
jgi:predicted DNA-binding transcriptional regulator AlpA